MKNKIEEIRKQKGITQEDFAKTLGVSRQTISSLETGRYNPSIFLAYKIARCFEMTIEEIFIFPPRFFVQNPTFDNFRDLGKYIEYRFCLSHK